VSSDPSSPSIRRRLACLFYETLLLAAVLAVTYLLPLAVAASIRGSAPPSALSWLYLLAVSGCYFVWQWRRGQTLAMRTWGIALQAADGGVPSHRQLVVRYLLAWASIGVLGIGIVWALFDPNRQFLHDRLAGTRLIRRLVA
jgi:uncharacterized RDD family membrane protein YckC